MDLFILCLAGFIAFSFLYTGVFIGGRILNTLMGNSRSSQKSDELMAIEELLAQIEELEQQAQQLQHKAVIGMNK